MLVKRTIYQGEYSKKLKSEVDSFLSSYTKSFNLFPWNSVSKVLSVKDLKDKVVEIDKNEYTISELINLVNQKHSKLKGQVKSGYFKYIFNGFLKESSRKDKEETELIYNDYSNQLQVIFKEMKMDLEFCLSVLKKVNTELKSLGKQDRVIKESVSSDKKKFMEDYENFIKKDSIGKYLKKCKLNTHESKKGKMNFLAIVDGAEDYRLICEKLGKHVKYAGEPIEFHTCYLPGNVFLYVIFPEIKTESEEHTKMIGCVTLESGSELDFRDFFIECYEDLLFSEASENKKKLPEKVQKVIDALKSSIKKLRNWRKKCHVVKESTNDEITQGSIDELKASIECDVEALLAVKQIKTSINMFGKTDFIVSLSIEINNILSGMVVQLSDDQLRGYGPKFRIAKEKLLNAMESGDNSEMKKCCLEGIGLVEDLLKDELKAMKEELKKKEAELKNSKESSEYHEKVLSIYTACKNGEITIEEREELLDKLNNEKFINENATAETSISKKEKFDKVVKSLYERCHRGEFDIDQREILIEKAKDMIFGEDDDKEEEKNNVKEEDGDGQEYSDICGEANNLSNSSADFANAIGNITLNTN